MIQHVVLNFFERMNKMREKHSSTCSRISWLNWKNLIFIAPNYILFLFILLIPLKTTGWTKSDREEKGKGGGKMTVMEGAKVIYGDKQFGETHFVVISPTINHFFSWCLDIIV